MITEKIRLTGPGAVGTRVNASVLREVLTLAIVGSQRALRVRAEGRSTAGGNLPGWIATATDFVVEIHKGSTVLSIQAPTLIEADPDRFKQHTMFPDFDPDDTAIDVLADSINAAVHQSDSYLYDRQLLRCFESFEPVFAHGITKVEFQTRRSTRVPIAIVREHIPEFRKLQREIPAPQYVRIVGKLDWIRHSDRTFHLTTEGQRIKGVVDAGKLPELQRLWGEDVLVTGTCHFTASGNVLRIEADVIAPATEMDEQLWAIAPQPLLTHEAERSFHVPQRPGTGLTAIFGKWPGDESDAEINAVLEDLS